MTVRSLGTIVVVIAIVVAGCTPVGDDADIDADIDVQGHRGARQLRPENTLPSFEVALDAGVSTLELDLHLSRDGQLVVWHDPEISPDKCRTEGNVPDPATLPLVRSLTASELAQYVCDVNPDPYGVLRPQEADPGVVAAGNYSLVTLPQLFDFVERYANDDRKTEDQRANSETVQFNVETKRSPARPETIGDGFDGTNPGEFEHALADVIDDWDYNDRVTVQSFDHRSLWAIRTIAPDVQLALLTGGDGNPYFKTLPDKGATIWSPPFASLSADVVARAHTFGVKVIPWTVNSESGVCNMLAMGVDGLITDQPDMVLGDGGWLEGCQTGT